MKATLRLFLFLTAFSGFLLTSCEPDDTTNPGDDPRDPFIGAWQFIESFKSTEGQSFIVTITKDPNNSSQVILENFGNPGSQAVSVTGIVTSKQIVISQQNMSNGWTVEGSGETTNVAKTSMSWSYAITAGGDKTDYTATSTRQ